LTSDAAIEEPLVGIAKLIVGQIRTLFLIYLPSPEFFPNN
jgi:hypothetical protein